MPEPIHELPPEDVLRACQVLVEHGYRVEHFQFASFLAADAADSAESDILVSVAWPGVAPACYALRPSAWLGEFERDVSGLRFDRRAVARTAPR